MAIQGFDYKKFSEELATQAAGLIPAEFQDFQRNYISKTILNFATMSGESICNDEAANFNADQAMLLIQIIAEWSFHKSIDIIRSGIMPDYWDSIMQKIAFTIFEVSKQTIGQNIDQDEILKIVEHHVKKTYEKAITDLKNRDAIDEETCQRALGQSNIDKMMQEMQEQNQQTAGSATNDSAKILKLATVALLLRQVQQDKVQTILNKFSQDDANMVIQYMQMPDLESKIDMGLTMKCLHEIKGNLPEPKNISPKKILANMKVIFELAPKEKIDRVVSKERPFVKDFIRKARDGECLPLAPKVTNIIIQHLEESLT